MISFLAIPCDPDEYLKLFLENQPIIFRDIKGLQLTSEAPLHIGFENVSNDYTIPFNVTFQATIDSNTGPTSLHILREGSTITERVPISCGRFHLFFSELPYIRIGYANDDCDESSVFRTDITCGEFHP